MLRAMVWKKSPPALIDTFDAVVPGPPAERRQMFGYPAAFVNGNLFASLFSDTLVLRLGPDGTAELLELGGRPFEPMAGRPMRGYAVVPDSLLRDEPVLAARVRDALAFARSLPAK
jgi:TfoX/Sxy family transcriptional regulator of competence genes